MGNAEDLARRRLQQAAVKGFNPAKVRDLAHGLIGQMRSTGTITALEMASVGDAIFVTVAMTLLEVAAPGAAREAVRKELVAIIDRMRRDIETGPEGSPEVM